MSRLRRRGSSRWPAATSKRPQRPAASDETSRSPRRSRRPAAIGPTSSTRPSAGFMMGNPNAKVKLVEIGALTCPHCREFDEEGVPTLVDKYVKSGQVSWEFRTYLLHGRRHSGGADRPLQRRRELLPAGDSALYKDQPTGWARSSAVPQAQLEQIQNLPPKPAVRRDGAARRAAGLGGGARRAAGEEQPVPDRPARIDQLVQMSERRAEPISRLPGHAVVHHQRHDARRIRRPGRSSSRSSRQALK